MNNLWFVILCVTLASGRPSHAAAVFGDPPSPSQADRTNKDNSSSPEEFLTAHSNHGLSRDFILSLYNNLTKGISLNQATGRPKHWQEVNLANTIRSFPATASYELRQQLVYRFNVSQIESRERLRVAELRVRFPTSWSFRQHLNVVAVASKDNSLIYASTIPIVTTHPGPNEFRIIDITSTVRDWLEFAHFRKLENNITLDLAFSVFSRRKAMTRSKFLRQLERFYEVEMTSGATSEVTPPSDVILVTYTETGGFFGETVRHRTTRDTTSGQRRSNVAGTVDLTPGSLTDVLAARGRSSRSSGSHIKAAGRQRMNNANEPTNHPALCRRRDMEIDFPALGWGEWVVYPSLYNAFQCTGKCGGFSDSQNNPTNHAIVQSLVKLVARSDIPMSCCTPTKLSPLSILYLEKGSVVLKHHEEMIVDECGCM